MKRSSSLNQKLSEKGLSLIELIIAVGLSGFIALILLNSQGFFQQQYTHTERSIDDGINRYRIDSNLFNDLHNSMSSFNKLVLSSDENENFYELNYNSAGKVRFTLSETSDDFIILVFNDRSHGMKFEVPLESLPAQLNSSTAINIHDNLTHNPDPLSFNHFSPWSQAGDILLMTSGNDYPYSVSSNELRPAPYFFVGAVSSDLGDLDPISRLPADVELASDRLKSSAQALITDTPVLKGLNDRFFVSPVQLIRYRIDSSMNEKQLLRSVGVLDSQGAISFAREVVLGERIEKVVFERALSQPLINFKVYTQR